MRLSLFILLFYAVLVRGEVAGPPLLARAAKQWLEEGNHWAFTVQVREFDGGAVKEERVERYDPSKSGAERWELVAVDGRTPTEESRLAWQKKKARKHRDAPLELADYLDFENARIAGVTPLTVRYHLPMRSNRGWLLPVDRVALTVTVNKTTYAIEKVEARIDEPYRVALGLGRILDLDFDLIFNPSGEAGAVVGPATAQPAGIAHLVVARLGERIDYTWSDFRRVTPWPGNLGAAKPGI